MLIVLGNHGDLQMIWKKSAVKPGKPSTSSDVSTNCHTIFGIPESINRHPDNLGKQFPLNH